MFSLTPVDLSLRILDIGGGPSSFTSTLSWMGGRSVSADPIYAFSSGQIRDRIEEARGEIVDQMRANMHDYVWDERIPSLDALISLRTGAMDEFLADYDDGRTHGRYVAAALPSLPFEDREFGLALCSHFLFLYSERLPLEFHVESLIELMRVAREARVYPLLELAGCKSRHQDGVIAALGAAGLTARIERVPYEFQKGSFQMLKVRKD